jgi:hypothetical protein
VSRKLCVAKTKQCVANKTAHRVPSRADY